MDDRYLATYPCYVMYIPRLTYNRSTHALSSSRTLNFYSKLEDSGERSLLVFSNLDCCANFVHGFTNIKEMLAILPVPDAETLANIVLSIKATEGFAVHVRVDMSNSFQGHWLSHESVASGGTDEAPNLEE